MNLCTAQFYPESSDVELSEGCRSPRTVITAGPSIPELDSGGGGGGGGDSIITDFPVVLENPVTATGR